jgi:hypothetical protein
VADHFHYEYAEARHDHRGDYADDRHDHDLDYAERYHRHYDDESRVAGLREDLGRAEARISELEGDLRDVLERIRALEDRADAGHEDQGDEDSGSALIEESIRTGTPVIVENEPVVCGYAYALGGVVRYCVLEPPDHEGDHADEDGSVLPVEDHGDTRVWPDDWSARSAPEADQDHKPTAVAECGCPKANSMIRHQRATCTDPIVARLDWYSGDAPGGE